MVGTGNSDYDLSFDNGPAYKGTAETDTYGLRVIDDHVFIDATFTEGSGELENSDLEFETTEETYSLGVMANKKSIYLSYYAAESLVNVAGGEQIKFKPFGWKYGWSGPVSNFGSGWLGYTFGLAFMEAEITRTSGSTVVSERSEPSYGYNVGLNYTYPVTRNFTIHGEAQHNVNEYSFTGLTREETFTHYFLSAAYQF